ncbi:MAG TPA: hypothetical protein VGM32_06505 [Rhodopila sp.]
MKTQMVPRGVVSVNDDRVAVQSIAAYHPNDATALGKLAVPSTPAVPPTISEAGLYETFDAMVPSGASRLRQFVARLEDEAHGTTRLTQATIALEGTVADRTMRLGSVHADSGMLWFDYVVDQATSLGRRDAALRYYRALANLVADEKLRAKKIHPATKTGTAGLPADDLLSRQAEWLGAIRCYLAEISNSTESPGSG